MYHHHKIPNQFVHLLGAADMEIVAYIGGSIIQKIRKYAIRLTDKNKKKQIFLSCIETMIGSNTTKLVFVNTRGGLLNATDGMLRIFAIMEKQFRTMFGEGVECVVEMSENSFVNYIIIIIIHTFITRTTSNGEERITGAGWSRGYRLNDKLKKWVLSLSLKLLREVQFRISRGISYHTVGAATEKARLAKTVPQ